jgi:ectoine hydroxylase-related dioxygenase (phytanoyl-CoA dioxygenase family)
MNTPWTESPFFSEELATRNLSDAEKQLCREFSENGFVILRGLLSTADADALVARLAPHFPEEIDLQVNRNQDLWEKETLVKNLACNTRVLDALRLLYGKEPMPFQTLNFKYGSQQRAHSDSIHFSSIPERFMCGVWVALEDTHTDNGPLFYYPKSHTEKQYTYFDIGIPEDNPGSGDGLQKGDGYLNYAQYEDFIEKFVTTRQFEKQELHIQKGDALIWASNLIHGGKMVLQKDQTRWSQVTHYYFEDCMYYTPMWSNPEIGELFLRNPRNILTGKEVPSTFKQRVPKLLFAGNNKHYAFKSIDPSLLKHLRWKEISILLKDRIKLQMKRKH